jgi:hypothetical protein
VIQLHNERLKKKNIIKSLDIEWAKDGVDFIIQAMSMER